MFIVTEYAALRFIPIALRLAKNSTEFLANLNAIGLNFENQN